MTYSGCVSAALVIQHAKRMRPTVIGGLCVSTIFSSTASSSCICVKNDCHRVKTQLQLNNNNNYYYYYTVFLMMGTQLPETRREIEINILIFFHIIP